MEKLLTLQITIFLLTATGFLVKRIGLVGPQGQRNLNDLVIYVVLPCNIFKAFLNSSIEGKAGSFLTVFLISVGIQAFCVVYGKLMFRRESEGRRKCLEYGTICSNAGFLGNPIAEGLYGAEGLVLASIYLIPLRVMMWSAGIAAFSGTHDRRQTVKRVLTHPCIIACAAGIVFMVAGWSLPGWLMGAVTSISSCNTALSMMVIGMILADLKLKELWDWTAFRYCLHRLILIPAVVLAVCRCFQISGMALGVCVILSAMPAGATTSILAEKYRVETAFATKMVILSTLLSLPTVALWSVVLQRLG